MQLKLGFPDLADPTRSMWEALHPEAREALVRALARVIAQAVRPPQQNKKKEDRDER
jgi:hypothetical protein